MSYTNDTAFKFEYCKMSVDKIVKEFKSKKRWTFVSISKLVVYIMVVLLLGSILFWLCLRSVLDYSKWPIYTETNIVSQNKAKFPSMTFCALTSGYKENVLKVNNINRWSFTDENENYESIIPLIQ